MSTNKKNAIFDLLWSRSTSGVNRMMFNCAEHNGKVLHRMFSLLESHQLCDVLLIAGNDGKRVNAHRLVLSASSVYFAAMFTGSMLESKAKEITLLDVDGNVLQGIVEFCYTGNIELREDNLENLIYAADLLQLNTVLDACTEYIVSHLKPSNCLGIASYADDYNLQALLEKSNTYICQHFTELIKYEEFFKLNCEEVRKILSNDYLHVDSEEMIFNSLNSWINHDAEQRELYIPGLLETVRLSQLEPSFIFQHVQPVCKSLESKEMLLNALKLQLDPTVRFQMENKCNKPRKSTIKLLAVTSTGSSCHLQSYCPNLNTWTKRKIYYFADRVFFGIVKLNNNLIILGGQRDMTPVKCVYSLDISTLNATPLNEMNEPRSAFGVAVLNGFLYAIGGYIAKGVTTASAERCDLATGTWSYFSPMLCSRGDFVLAVLDGCLYAMGGSTNSVECYDPQSDAWSQRASMNQKSIELCAIVTDGHLYAVGNVKDMQIVERYDPIADKWSYVNFPGILNAAKRTCSFINIRSVICTTIGNRFLAADSKGAVQEYNALTDQWVSHSSIPCDKLVHLIYPNNI